MGNEQSGSSNVGISTSLSFLASRKKVSSSVKKKAGQVVVVRSGSTVPNPDDDRILKKFKDIPKFYPVLRASLHQPGLHDPPDLKKKMSPRPIIRLATCLQEYFERCARLVANEQEYIGVKIKDVDYYIVTLLTKINGHQRSMEIFTNQVEKIRDVNDELDNLKCKMANLISEIEQLNQILPVSERLPSLDMEHLMERTPASSVSSVSSATISSISQSPGSDEIDSLQNLHIEPVEELAVVDKVFRK